MQRVARFIGQMGARLNFICFTLDSHHLHAIFHPSWWADGEGNHPAPFTQIALADVRSGKWIPTRRPAESLAYLESLEAQGRFTHTIWPVHCLMGSQGASVYAPVMQAIVGWSQVTGNDYLPLVKGSFPIAEHYGIFAAEVPQTDVPETKFNHALLQQLSAFDTVYLAGEAKSHCVGTTLRQLLEAAPDIGAKLVVLVDAMSPVPGFEHLADPIYARAAELGVQFAQTTD
jgi:nicotinamidase-related amidase